MPKNVLLITNRRLEEKSGRVEKLITRKNHLEDNGWKVTLFYIPNKFAFFKKLPELFSLISIGKIDICWTINEPSYLHLLGWISKWLTGTGWIAELRDPLLENPNCKNNSLSKYFRIVLENLVVNYADKVVWIDGIQQEENYFQEEYPGSDHTKFHKLPFIGFEREKFSKISPKEYECYTMVYAGSFYQGWLEPKRFLKGLASYINNNNDVPKVQVIFYGDWSKEYTQICEDLQLENVVLSKGYAEHQRVISALKGADSLLYIGGDDPKNKLNIPSKMWDYIGAGNPIFALADREFRASKFIKQNQLGVVVEPEVDSIRQGLEKLITSTDLFGFKEDIKGKYYRKYHDEGFIQALAEMNPQ